MILLQGSAPYAELSKFYGQVQISDSKPIPVKTISLSHRKSVSSVYHHPEIRVLPHHVELTLGGPFMRSLVIPASEIAYCGMTCFGTDDQNVDLIIPRTESIIMIENKTEMLNWCWDNQKPIITGKDKRNWEYSGHPLPPISSYSAQLKSRTLFDKQVCQSCLGY